MQPNHFDLLGHGRDGAGDSRPMLTREAVSRSDSAARRLRSEDSWVEIASQPSSSSLSSATTDDIVTTGLRVQHDSNNHRRRRLRPNAPSGVNGPSRRLSTAGSSQDEYEESESESDRVLGSSSEDILPQGHPRVQRSTSSAEDGSEDDDDDGNSTALGVVGDERTFTPQPNAFSHPISQSNRSAPGAAQSYFPPTPSSSSHTAAQRHSYPSQRPQSHTPFNLLSPSHQADHDAALRASLSTLLSCAAAARGLPKREQHAATSARSGNRIEPTTLRMVPESVLMGEETEAPPLPRRPGHRTSASSSSAGIPVPVKGKRKASSSKDRRSTKKSRRTDMGDVISPTLMTWVISAGVVVLFSAISFSAGYALGKEVGRAEVGVVGANGQSISCGREAMKGGLKRLRWGAASSPSVRA